MLKLFKKYFVSIPRINDLLNKTLHFYSYKKIVINKVLPKLESIGIFSKIDSQNKIKILVPYIETSFKKIFVFIIILKALQLRGAEILFLICNKGLERCETFSVRTPSGGCHYCNFINKTILPRFGFTVIQINDFITKSDKKNINKISKQIFDDKITQYKYYDIDIMPIVRDSLFRYGYGMNPVKNNDQKIKYIETALISTLVAEKINRKYKPDIIVSHMEGYVEFHCYNLFFAKHTKIPNYTLKPTEWNLSTVTVNYEEHFYSNDRFNQFLKNRKNNKITSNEKKQLYDFINQRIGGESADIKGYGYFEESESSHGLNIDSSKKNIFFFPNVDWDVGFFDKKTIFNSLMDSIDFTIDTIKDRKDIHLYIKIHPAEVYGPKSEKTMAERIIERYDPFPINITIITPEQRIKPYDLFNEIDLGIIYNGTLGLEMCLQNVPVVSVGRAPYTGIGLSIDPNTKNEYREILLTKNNQFSRDKNLTELFAYYYFIKSLIPITLFDEFHSFDIVQIPEYYFDNVSQLNKGNNYYLDHLCDVILENKFPENY